MSKGELKNELKNLEQYINKTFKRDNGGVYSLKQDTIIVSDIVDNITKVLNKINEIKLQARVEGKGVDKKISRTQEKLNNLQLVDIMQNLKQISPTDKTQIDGLIKQIERHGGKGKVINTGDEVHSGDDSVGPGSDSDVLLKEGHHHKSPRRR